MKKKKPNDKWVRLQVLMPRTDKEELRKKAFKLKKKMSTIIFEAYKSYYSEGN